MAAVRETGRTLFGDNCAVCHGRDAKGAGLPRPHATTSWLWGGSPEAIAETIRVGINSAHPDSRISQMPAFGRDEMLERHRHRERRCLCAEPQRSGGEGCRPAMPKPARPCSRRTASSVTAPTARARPTSARPTSPTAIWIHGGDETSIYNDVWGGRQGQMPSWEGRLSPVDRKILALYLVDLGKPRP